MVEKNYLPMLFFTENLYDTTVEDDALVTIQTYYEKMWLERGIPIKYVKFRLPRQGTLEEPNVEIPVDGYRSYNHEVVSTRTTGK
jgi:tRNA (guanine-N7-)-methyltransferase